VDYSATTDLNKGRSGDPHCERFRRCFPLPKFRRAGPVGFLWENFESGAIVSYRTALSFLGRLWLFGDCVRESSNFDDGSDEPSISKNE
jgi:hypothetical protein